MAESGTVAEQITVLRERVAALEAKSSAHETALVMAKAELDRRLEEMNEFRGQINEERREYLDRDTYFREHNILVDRVTKMEQERTYNKDFNAMGNRVSELERSRAGAVGTLGAYGSVIAFLVAIAALILAYLRIR